MYVNNLKKIMNILHRHKIGEKTDLIRGIV